MKNECFVSVTGLVLLLALTSCTDHYVANVSLNNAMTEYGRINSNDLRIGTVLLWHQKTLGAPDPGPRGDRLTQVSDCLAHEQRADMCASFHQHSERRPISHLFRHDRGLILALV